jgi:hypothetical protein
MRVKECKPLFLGELGGSKSTFGEVPPPPPPPPGHGTAVQLDPIKPKLKAPGSQELSA